MDFGQKVIAVAYMKRTTIVGNGGWSWARKVWSRVEFAAPKDGILVGFRTLSNGHRVNLGDEGMAYKATEFRRAALVAFDLRSSPRFVDMTDLQKPNAQSTSTDAEAYVG